MRRRTLISGFAALLAVAAAPALPVLAHDRRVTHGVSFLREDVVGDPRSFGLVLRMMGECQGHFAYAAVVVDPVAWNSLYFRDHAREVCKEEMRLFFRRKGLRA